jgi:hypothetical protein
LEIANELEISPKRLLLYVVFFLACHSPPEPARNAGQAATRDALTNRNPYRLPHHFLNTVAVPKNMHERRKEYNHIRVRGSVEHSQN